MEKRNVPCESKYLHVNIRSPRPGLPWFLATSQICCSNLFVISRWSSYGQRHFREHPYKTDEGGDVCPAVLHEWIRTISNHVCDVLVETLRTFGNQKVNKVSLGDIIQVKTTCGVTDRTPSQCWPTRTGKGGVKWCHCRHDGPTTGASTSPPIKKIRQ